MILFLALALSMAEEPTDEMKFRAQEAAKEKGMLGTAGTFRL